MVVGDALNVCAVFAALYQGNSGVSGLPTQSNQPAQGMLHMNMGMNGMTQQQAPATGMMYLV